VVEAIECYRRAVGLGSPVSQFNLAITLEVKGDPLRHTQEAPNRRLFVRKIAGKWQESEELFNKILADAVSVGLPSRHIAVRLATVMPRCACVSSQMLFV
jgi:hypothetical protein